MPSQALVQTVFDLIYKSDKMEYLWSQKTDDVKHTGIVIKFDHTPKFILDFGADLHTAGAKLKVGAVLLSGSISPLGKTRKATSKMTLGGRVTISNFSSSDIDIKGKLVKLSLKTTAEKENAVNLFISIKNLDAGDYNLIENNCRTYVVTIACLLSELPEFKSENFKAFEEKMQTLRSEDQTRFEKCWETAAAFIEEKRRVMNRLLDAETNENLPIAKGSETRAAVVKTFSDLECKASPNF